MSGTAQAHFNMVLHTNQITSGSSAYYQNPDPSDANNSVINANGATNQSRVVAQAIWNGNPTTWTKIKQPFTYTEGDKTPSFILITLSTNATPGGGSAGDKVFYDDIELIYNTRLDNLTVNGTTIQGFNKDILEYTYPNEVCGNDLASLSIVGTPKSSHATATISHVPTVDEPYAIVHVTHKNQENDNNVSKNYRINFNLASVNVELDNNGNYTVCQGQTVTMNASGADSYVWSNGLGNNSSAQITLTQVGTYEYTVTGTSNINGCSVSNIATAHVTVVASPNVTINGSTTGCTSVNLTATGATSFSWSDGTTGNTWSTTTVGDYSLTVTGTTGNCSGTATVQVHVYGNPIVVISGPNTVCTGESTTLTASGATSYSWSNGATGDAITPTTSGPYTVTGTSNGCTATASHNITINETPTVTISGVTAICSGNNTTLTAQSTVPNTTYTWSDNSTDNTLTVSTGGQYSVTGSSNGCTNTATVTVNVADLPAEPTVTNVSRCGAGEITLTATAPTGCTTYWYLSENTNEFTNTGDTNTTTLQQSFTYYVAARNAAGCFSARVPVTATVIPAPTTPSVTAVSNCGAYNDFTLTATGSNLQWFADANATQPIENMTLNVTATTTYYVRSGDENCHSELVPLTITINDNPAKPTNITANPASLCGSGNVTISATPATDCQLNWFLVNNPSSASDAFSTNNSVQRNNVNSTTTYYVRSYNTTTGCYSEMDSVSVVVSPALDPTPVAGATLCAAGEVTLTGTPGEGNTLRWYLNNELVHTGTSYTPMINGNTAFQVATYNETSGCESDRYPVNVTISATVPAPTVEASTVYACGGNATLQARAGQGTTLQWYDAAGNAITGATGATYTVSNLSANAQYQVAASQGSCQSAMTTVDVVVVNVNAPATPTLSASSVCGSDDVTMTVTLAEGQNAHWYANGTTTTVLATGSTYTATVNSSNNTFFVAVFDETSNCESARTSVTVTVNAIPEKPTIASANRDIEHCGTYEDLTLTATAPAGCTLQWFTDRAATQAVENTTLDVANTTTFYVRSYNGNCSSQMDSIVVTINPIPGVPSVVTPEPRCGSATGTIPVSITGTPGANGTVCHWYNADGVYQLGQNTYGGNFATSFSLLVSSYNSNTHCESEQITVNVVINNPPVAPTLTGDTRCGEGEVTLSATGGTADDTYAWYASADATEAFFTGATYTPMLSQSATYYVATVNPTTGCSSQRRTVTATINPAPAAPTTQDIDVCGAQNVTLTATSDANLHWYASQEGGEALTSTTVSLNEGVTTYYVAAYNTNCESERVPLAVTVNAIPVLSDVTGDERCGEGTVTLSATASEGAIVRWFANATDNEPVATGTTYAPSISQSTTYYVQAYNESTSCHSTLGNVTAVMNETYDTEFSETACDSFVWAGQTYSISGDYQHTFQSVNGCDSIVTLHLTVNQSQQTTVDTVVCNQFVWGGDTYTQSTSITKTFNSSTNCDSVVTVNLTVLQSTTGTESLTFCSNQLPADYHNTTIDHAGTYTVTIPNAAGCDSTITLTVIVNPQPGVATMTPQSRCGEGVVILSATSGQNANTCYWYADETTTDTLHSGFAYQPTISGTTTYYVASVNTTTGCMSARTAVTATVNPNPAAPTASDVSRCGRGPITLTAHTDDANANIRWFATSSANTPIATGVTYTNEDQVTPTTYYLDCIYENTGCKSNRVPVQAIVNPIPAAPQVTDLTNCGPATLTLAATVPEGSNAQWYATNDTTQLLNNTSVSVEDNATYYVRSNDGTCASQLTSLNITIYPVYQAQDLYDTVCQGVAYTGYGLNNTYTVSGEQTIALAAQSINGCDSVVTLHLMVNPTASSEFTEVACNSYTWEGTTYQESGNFVKHFLTVNGCDSVVTLHLTINRTVNNSISATACDSYAWNDSTYTTSGDYVQTFIAANSCDSVVTLHLTINNSVATEFTEVACNSYTWDGSTYTTSGDYTKEYETLAGCDSIVTLHLTINYSNNIVMNDTVCEGGAYTNNGFDTTLTAGTYTLTHSGTNQYGCDSTTTLHLVVNPVYNISITAMTCTGQSYPFNGQNLTTAGTYTANLQSVNGCDSTVTLTLTVGAEWRDTITAHVCYGGSYNANGFNISNATTSQFYSNSGTSASGCDSTMVLRLVVHDLNTTELNASICLGQTYNLNGFNITPTVAGMFDTTKIVKTAFQCDSTVVLHLMVNPTYYFSDTITTCQSSTPYHYAVENDDIVVNTPGTKTKTYNHTTATGCDSIRTLTLIVNRSYNQQYTGTVCAGSAYTQHGFDTTFVEEGQYTLVHEFVTAKGCDSIVTVVLTVNPVKTTNLTATLCQGESYTQNGFDVTPTNDTIYVRNLSAVGTGCDSIVTLTVTVNPVYHNNYTGTVCLGDVYTGNGFEVTPDAAGVFTYVDSSTTVNGCDSISSLTLTVNPSYNLSYTASICEGNTFAQYGFDTTFTEAGVYELSYEGATINGCDSNVTVMLTVNPIYSVDTTVDICDEALPFKWNNDNAYSYMESGNYTISYSTVSGCDSIVNLHLNVHPSFEIDTVIQTCEGALPYQFDENNSFNGTGNYTVALQTAFGCDSIYHIQLIVTPSITHTVTRNICESALPFTLGDSIFTQAGEYEVVATSAGGCTEITYLTLNVYPEFVETQTVTVCANELPYVHDATHSYTEAGTYTLDYTTAHGCDSTVTLTLNVTPNPTSVDTRAVCAGEFPIVYGDSTISAAGEYNIVFEREGLCDSLVTLTVIENPVYVFDSTMAVCSDETPYLWHGQSLTESGTFVDEHQTVAGCDSIYTLHLTVNNTFLQNDTVTICSDETPYDWHNRSLTTSGLYADTLTTVAGCDSVYTLNLIVNPKYFFDEQVSVCSNALPFEWHGKTFNNDAVAYDSLTTLAGCDSIYKLTLTVAEYTVINDDPIVFCQGETVMWREMTISETGIYYDTVTTTAGSCPTVYAVNVTVNPSYHFVDTMAVCADQLPYIWHEQRFTKDTTITVRYQTAATFCDSVYQLTFIVRPVYANTEDLTVCADAVPHEWHGQYLSENGTYYDTLTTVYGCDSTFVLNFNVQTVTAVNDTMLVCDETTYAWHNQTLTESGVYYDTVRTVTGCDSLVYSLALTMGTSFYDIDTVTVDEGFGTYAWHNMNITAPGLYSDSSLTTTGCDSVYQLMLTVNSTQIIESTPIQLCQGDSVQWRGRWINAADTYTDTVGNVIFRVVVTVNPSYAYYDTVTVCQSELPYFWHNRSLTAAGVYTDLHQTAETGCDSTYHLTLFVNQTYLLEETQTICASEAPYSWHGRELAVGGVYYDSLQTAAFCDSIYKLTLTINPAVYQEDTAVTCEGTPYVWRGHSLTQSNVYRDTVPNTYGCQDIYVLHLTVNPIYRDTVRATICQGETYNENGFNVTPTTYGTIYDQLTLSTQQGCDSTIILILTVNRTFSYEETASTCEGTPFEWRGSMYLVEGTYYDSLQTQSGCDSVYVLHLTVNPSYDIYYEDSVLLNHTYENYGFVVNATDTGVFEYTMNYFTVMGCDSVIHLTLHVNSNIGVQDYELPQLRVYPNPATTFINIESERMQKISVYDMHGRLVKIQDADSPEFTRLEIENATAGFYILKIQLMDGAILTKKFVVNRF
ncbi:MAG: T9SS type A sorting domain-containing protein [Bacteroidales bacterium]|nr:T9SS type A sorting domain-containing protein [Bacteroidales bacterium]